MKCAVCGAEMGELGYCEKCGSVVAAREASDGGNVACDGASCSGVPDDAGAGAPDAAGDGRSEPRKASAGRRVGVVVAVAVVVVALAAFALTQMGGHDTREPESQQGQFASAGATGDANAAGSAALGGPEGESPEAVFDARDVSRADSVSSAASAPSGDASAESSPSQGDGAFGDSAFDPACVDELGNPTLYALVELDGADLQALAQECGFVWYDEAVAWLSAPGGMLAVLDAERNLGRRDIAKMRKGAGDAAVIYLLAVEGRSSAADALAASAANTQVELEHQTGDALFAVVRNAKGARYLVVATQTGDAEQTLLVYTENAIARGLFDSSVGMEAGSTIDDVWTSVTR